MPSTNLLARDHLERAAAILSGADAQTRELRRILDRMIALMREIERREERAPGKIIEFAAFQRRREGPSTDWF